MKPTRIHSKAPTRIDLAGGTVDLWPIYLFLDNPKTINLGISLFAETDLELKAGSGQIQFKSKDQGHEHSFHLNNLTEKAEHPALVLHQRLLMHFLRRYPDLQIKLSKFDLTVQTTAKSPAGAGLGGSSTLAVSITHAYWNCFFPDKAPNPIHLVEIVRDVETQVIQVPAGLQDYYGATFGGLQSIHWKEAVSDRVIFSENQVSELQKRLILFYSGHSRNSGINNWQLFKSFIDKQPEVVQAFKEIVAAATDLENALHQENYLQAVLAIQKEWKARSTLASGISTSEIDQAYQIAMETVRSHSNQTELAMKICGAGGGGCFFFILSKSDPELIETIVQKITKEIPKIQRLPFEAASHGIQIKQQGFTE